MSLRVTYNTDTLRYHTTWKDSRPREKEINSGIKSLFLLLFFAHKKYSRRFINLRLSHCSHLDYINDVFNTFSGPESYNALEAYGGVIQLSDLIKNIFICVPKINESIEQHEGE